MDGFAEEEGSFTLNFVAPSRLHNAPPIGLGVIAGAQAFLRAGFVVLDEVDARLASWNIRYWCSFCSSSVEEATKGRRATLVTACKVSGAIRKSARCLSFCLRFLRPTTSCLQGANLYLEARVGIERSLHGPPTSNPDLQAHFNAVFTGVQEVSNTIRSLPVLSRHAPGFYSAIEEIVEGFCGQMRDLPEGIRARSVLASNLAGHVPMLLVASSSHSGSASKEITSIALKYFTALGFGLPSPEN